MHDTQQLYSLCLQCNSLTFAFLLICLLPDGGLLDGTIPQFTQLYSRVSCFFSVYTLRFPSFDVENELIVAYFDIKTYTKLGFLIKTLKLAD